MNLPLLIAAALSGLAWGVHTFVGGPQLVPPLLAAEMHPVPKHTHYYCWHLVTLTLAAMPLGYLYAALSPSGWDVALLLTVLSGAFTIWSLLLVAWKRQRWMQMPQWLIFLVITGVALPGLF